MLGFFLQEIVLKYAVIGKGKTGSHIIDLLKERKLSYGVFDSQNTITPEALKDYDVAICFVNAPTFRLLKPILVYSQIPLVIGTTGIEWDESLLSEIKEAKCRWIKSANFSIGINLINEILSNNFSKLKSIYPNYQFKIHEEHHEKKLDAPSGTALRFAEILDHPIEITHTREGDTLGIHSVSLITQDETLTITHKVNNRIVFAEGALAATYLFNDLEPGIYEFETLINKNT